MDSMTVIKGGEIPLIANFNPIDLTALSAEDKEMIKEVTPHFKGMYLGMSKYQIEKGVLAQHEFPTADSKYWQCSRELFTRMTSIIQTQYELNKLSLDVEDLTIQMKNSEEGSLAWRRLKNDRDYKVLQMNIQKINLEDTLRQMRDFRDAMKENDGKREFKTYEESQEPFWRAKNAFKALQQGNVFTQNRQ